MSTYQDEIYPFSVHSEFYSVLETEEALCCLDGSLLFSKDLTLISHGKAVRG